MLVVQYALIALCVVAFVLVVVALIQNRPAGRAVDALFAVIEAGLAVQLVLGLVRLGDPHPEISVVTWVGYLIGCLLILPVAWVWSLAERSRAGLGVLLVGLVVVPFLFLRLHQVWPGG